MNTHALAQHELDIAEPIGSATRGTSKKPRRLVSRLFSMWAAHSRHEVEELTRPEDDDGSEQGGSTELSYETMQERIQNYDRWL